MARPRSSVVCPIDPIGLKREEAAAFLRLSETKLDELVERGWLPQPHQVDRLVVWDADELREAFKLLPRRGLPKHDASDHDEGETYDFRV